MINIAIDSQVTFFQENVGMFLFGFVCVDALHPNPSVNNFSVMLGCVFLGLTITKQRIKCLVQGHNTVPLARLKPVTPRSQAEHSTTELLRICITPK